LLREAFQKQRSAAQRPLARKTFLPSPFPFFLSSSSTNLHPRLFNSIDISESPQPQPLPPASIIVPFCVPVRHSFKICTRTPISSSNSALFGARPRLLDPRRCQHLRNRLQLAQPPPRICATNSFKECPDALEPVESYLKPHHNSSRVPRTALHTMSMYGNHRGLGPAPGSGNARLNELLEGIRAEFENQARASGEYEHSSKRSQVTELQNCRSTAIIKAIANHIYSDSTNK
jgi:hypothetical protein